MVHEGLTNIYEYKELKMCKIFKMHNAGDTQRKKNR